MKIVLASCQDLPDWEIDDHRFHLELERQGIAFEIHPWDAKIDWSEFDLCLLRTTWDYSSRIEEFREWIQAVSAQTTLLNSSELVLWNLNKRYLQDLEQKGVPIAPTVWIKEAVSLKEVLKKEGWSKGFLKPVVGASASDTLRFSMKDIDKAQKFLEALVPQKEMILQPYLERVEIEGEFSAIYFGGEFSHCVQKIPVSGDYRVQDDYGAFDQAIEPIAALIDLAQRTLSTLNDPWIYARVDALRLEDGTWVLNELEMVEPSLFFRHSDVAAKKLTKCIKQNLLMTSTNKIARGIMNMDSLEAPEFYFNRELSLIAFNKRVLAQASLPETPLLERLRFLTIVSSNLDEFFEVRVAGVRHREALDLSMSTPDRLTPHQLMMEIRERTQEMVKEQYRILNEELLPALQKEGIRLRRRNEWNEKQKNWVRDYFREQVFPILTPIGLDSAHPFPNVQNKSLNFILSLKGKDAFNRESDLAILSVPRCLPRIIELPISRKNKELDHVLLSSVIHAHVGMLFPGMKVTGCYQFRVTRDADLFVDEEEVDDLLTALKGQLHGRNFGDAVRLEVADNCPKKMIDLLCEQHGLTELDLFQVSGPVNLHRLGSWVSLIDRADLKFQPFSPGVPHRLVGANSDLISILGREKEDILLHHPYRSFEPVVELLWNAAEDPDVLAIKMTLYRVGKNSPLVDALMEAARRGKEVTVVVELRARFDEAANINFAQKLIEAGVKVAYGIVGYKCHAKLMLFVRQEDKKLRRYAHVGTGNYHVQNARLYTDYSLLTTNPEITEDVHNVFMQLTGLGKVVKPKQIRQSPSSMLPSLLTWIKQEEEAARKGEEAWIVAKMNSLTDKEVIQALYRASQAGVQIDLIVRGICCLRPGIEGISENIRIRSIIGRFLEHHRIYSFKKAGVFISSADWMVRNLRRRVEVACPILDPTLKKRLLLELKEIFLRDNQQAWLMLPNGEYQRVKNDEEPFSSQDYLLNELGGK